MELAPCCAVPVELVSDRNDGPYAGVHRFAALEFIARAPGGDATRRTSR
jgi:hypothetical protein